MQKVYDEQVCLSAAVGLDNLSQRSFWKVRDEQIQIIERKVGAATYNFTNYKLKLISKGRGKIPREISIPTIRDRIALRALCDFLANVYAETIEFTIPQHLIRSIKQEIDTGKYDSFIKLDITQFFPSVRHQELQRRLRRKMRSPAIIDLIVRALRTPTVTRTSPKSSLESKGIPQGLSVSNILAAAYLLNIDRHFYSKNNLNYLRYVDDILILCSKDDVAEIVGEVRKRYRRIGLQIYEPTDGGDKSVVGSIGDVFTYLGYKFEGNAVGVREASVEKLKDSLVSIFSAYEHSSRKSEEFLLWRLNLRITGCIFRKKAKGWIFFFSEINDEKLLHTLDRYVDRLLERFSVSITPKRFVRSYYQVLHHRHRSTYIPNFDKFELDDMKLVLTTYFGTNLHQLTGEEIRYAFMKRIEKQVRDLLTDVQEVGY